MELLRLDEARPLMWTLRSRCSELCKLRVARQRQWYAEHPEVATRLERSHCLQDILGEDCFQRTLTPDEHVLLSELRLLLDQLMSLPKCPDGLNIAEDRELRNAMSQAEKLRRRLPSIPNTKYGNTRDRRDVHRSVID
jgi:hypothetical protein